MPTDERKRTLREIVEQQPAEVSRLLRVALKRDGRVSRQQRDDLKQLLLLEMLDPGDDKSKSGVVPPEQMRAGWLGAYLGGMVKNKVADVHRGRQRDMVDSAFYDDYTGKKGSVLRTPVQKVERKSKFVSMTPPAGLEDNADWFAGQLDDSYGNRHARYVRALDLSPIERRITAQHVPQLERTIEALLGRGPGPAPAVVLNALFRVVLTEFRNLKNGASSYIDSEAKCPRDPKRKAQRFDVAHGTEKQRAAALKYSKTHQAIYDFVREGDDWPSNKRIAAELRCHMHTVKNALDRWWAASEWFRTSYQKQWAVSTDQQKRNWLFDMDRRLVAARRRKEEADTHAADLAEYRAIYKLPEVVAYFGRCLSHLTEIPITHTAGEKAGGYTIGDHPVTILRRTMQLLDTGLDFFAATEQAHRERDDRTRRYKEQHTSGRATERTAARATEASLLPCKSAPTWVKMDDVNLGRIVAYRGSALNEPGPPPSLLLLPPDLFRQVACRELTKKDLTEAPSLVLTTGTAI